MFKKLLLSLILGVGLFCQANAQQEINLLVDGKPFDQDKSFFTNHTSLKLLLRECQEEEGFSIEVSVGHDSNKIISKASYSQVDAFNANAVKLASKVATKGDIIVVKVMPKNAKPSVFVLTVRG